MQCLTTFRTSGKIPNFYDGCVANYLCFRNYISSVEQNCASASSFWEKGKLRERCTRVCLKVMVKKMTTMEKAALIKEVKTQLLSCLAYYKVAGAYDNMSAVVSLAGKEFHFTMAEQLDLDLYRAWVMLAKGRQEEAEIKAKSVLEVARERKLRDRKGRASKILSTISDLRTGTKVFGEPA